MKHFRLIGDLFFERDLDMLRQQLDAQPGLWDRHTYRTTIPRGPFAGTSDIWVRTRRLDELDRPERHREPYWPVFYPAWHALPALHPIVGKIIAWMKPTHVGSILITRVPSGGQIAPHHDRGGWHAEFHRTKLYVPIRTNSECANYCGNERVVMKAGECWFFDNLVVHRVENDGDTDRETLIVCLRTIDDDLAQG